MYRGEKRGRQQAIPRHRKKDAGLTEHQHQHNGSDTCDGAKGDDKLPPVEADALERRGDRGIGINLTIRDHAGEHDCNEDIQHRAYNKRDDDSDGDITLRVTRFFGVSRNRIKPDVGEKYHRGAGEHSNGCAVRTGLSPDGMPENAQPSPAKRSERMPVGGLDIKRPDNNDKNHHKDLDCHHHIIKARAFMYANHQDDSNDGDDNEGREVEPASRLHKDSAGGIVVKGSTGKD